MKKILFISRIPTPHVVDLSEGIRKIDGWLADIWFIQAKLPPQKGKHWLDKVLNHSFVYFGEGGPKNNISLKDLINKNQYDYIISFFAPKPQYHFFKYIKNIPFFLWAEPPRPKNWLLDQIRMRIYRKEFKKINIKAVLAIGYKSQLDWQKILDCPCHVFPYLQDLNHGLKKKAYHDDLIRFIFSGQLIKRNNIEGILKAVEILYNKGIRNFKMTFFGRGEYEALIRKKKHLQNLIQLKNDDFCTQWNDRLIPLAESDVLVSPVNYAGWGMTIPEALSIGLPVISTSNAESAKYYLVDGVNGFFTTTKAEDIARIMEYFIKNQYLVQKMKNDCIEESKKGNIKNRIFSLLKIIDLYE